MNQTVRALSFWRWSWPWPLSSLHVAASVGEQLNVAEQRRYDALIGKDWPALAPIRSDEFFYNNAGGASTPKSAFVDLVKSGAAVVRRVARDEATVRPYGEVALLPGIPNVDVTLKGEDKTAFARTARLEDFRTGNWLLIYPRRNSPHRVVAGQETTPHILARDQAFSAR